MEQGFGLVGGQLLVIQQVKDLSDDGICRFREEVGFRKCGVWAGIELCRSSGLRILPAQFPNGVKDVLFGEQAFLFQHLYQGSHFSHAGESQFFEGDNVFGVEVFGHEGTRM